MSETQFRLRVAEAVLNGRAIVQRALVRDYWVVILPSGNDACERSVRACFERLFEAEDATATPCKHCGRIKGDHYVGLEPWCYMPGDTSKPETFYEAS